MQILLLFSIFLVTRFESLHPQPMANSYGVFSSYSKFAVRDFLTWQEAVAQQAVCVVVSE